MRYAIVRALARLLLAVFYRRVEVHGLERVPVEGPLVVAANHHNALVDPMLVLAALPRRLAPLAKAPLFVHPLIAPFLWLAGAIPVHRREDADGQPASNVAMFAAAVERLSRGGAVLVFPEGRSQPEPVLLPLRTGLARLTLAAEARAPGLGVTVLPIGLVFHRPAQFRTGRALVVIGEPVPTADLVRPHARDPEGAVRELTARVAAALRSLIVEADDRHTLRLLEVAQRVWHEDRDEVPGPERLGWMREALRRWRALPADLRERVEHLGTELARYEKDAELAGRSGERRSQEPARGAGRLAVREGVAAALGLPLTLLGVAINVPAYRATALLVRALRPEADAAATYQLAAGLVLFPLSWAIEAVVIAALLGAPAAWAFAALLLPAGFFALGWRDRLYQFHRGLGRGTGRLGGADVEARLRARRRWLRDELVTLAQLTEARRTDPRSADERR